MSWFYSGYLEFLRNLLSGDDAVIVMAVRGGHIEIKANDHAHANVSDEVANVREV
jgi:hypothetical protein